jgi:hypothetical protein
MTWTTERPTEPGWYWYKATKHLPAIIVYVYHSHNNPLPGNGLLVAYVGLDEHRNSAMISGEWAGPLEPPA